MCVRAGVCVRACRCVRARVGVCVRACVRACVWPFHESFHIVTRSVSTHLFLWMTLLTEASSISLVGPGNRTRRHADADSVRNKTSWYPQPGAMWKGVADRLFQMCLVVVYTVHFVSCLNFSWFCRVDLSKGLYTREEFWNCNYLRLIVRRWPSAIDWCQNPITYKLFV